MSSYLILGADTLLARIVVEELLARPDCTRITFLHQPLVHSGFARRNADASGHSAWSVVAADERLHTYPRTRPKDSIALLRRLAVTHDHVVCLPNYGCARSSEEDLDLTIRCARAARPHSTVHVVAPAPDAEWLLGAQSDLDVRRYHVAVLVGDARTGELPETPGPLDVLLPLTRLARTFGDLPIPDIFDGITNVVSTDYAAKALVALIHAEAEPNSRFELAQPEPEPISRVYRTLSAVAGGPSVAIPMPGIVTRGVTTSWSLGVAFVDALPFVGDVNRRVRRAVLTEIGFTEGLTQYWTPQILAQSVTTLSILDGLGFEPTPLADYAPKLYERWLAERDTDGAVHPVNAMARRLTGFAP
ncbi:hypothetical protein IEU95_02230 [Hoyosella rhizosphaerae]|uniref:Uncharacterized protein n=1 Tax=Hoyosella rhizosphaerae TaxID=1755582 RepID=A0A916XF63_9ACTN|nr:hypothetical protein [Hoyosella rhizosphaerae]MBN4925632.1 hypothetical protein [Hoyosella rhizosphaerae]GGC69126.1 hypothetical protein GCM10011410_22420 [Hoyosella rhizosphaerae]